MIRTFNYSFFFFLLLSVQLIPSPILSIDKGDRIDFGTVSFSNAKISSEVHVSNTGTSVFEISNIQVNCGCILALPDSYEILPGKLITINVTFDVSSFSGLITKQFIINSADRKIPGKIVELTANVLKPLIIFPEQLAFSGKIGQNIDGLITIKNNSQSEIVLNSFEVSPKELEFDNLQQISLKPGSEISIKVHGTIQKEAVENCIFTITTSDPEMPYLKIPCSIRSYK